MRCCYSEIQVQMLLNKKTALISLTKLPSNVSLMHEAMQSHRESLIHQFPSQFQPSFLALSVDRQLVL